MSVFGGDSRAVYVISVAADLAGMHAQTLRLYERKGLVTPKRSPGGSRRYSEEDIRLLLRIQELTAEGLNLEGVRQVIALEEENVRLQAENLRLRREIDDLKRQYRRELVPFGQFKLPG